MIHLANLIAPSNVLCHHPAKSRKRALQSVAELLASSEAAADTLFEALMERERLGSTGLGDGVAIPHCRIDTPAMQVALVSLAEPIDYESIDGQPVDLLFVLVVPIDENHAHLDALAELSRVFSQAHNRTRLRSCLDIESLTATMQDFLQAGDPQAHSKPA